MTEHIEVTNADSILTVRINRPEKKNALTRAMYRAMTEAIHTAETDDQVRVILITGIADCFSSGNDIMDFVERPPTGQDSPPFSFMQAISQAKKPLLAAVNGVAVGIGTTMLLHCDLVYAGQSARFQLPFVNLGLVPEAGSTYLLPRLMGHQRAAELLLLGQPFDADTAHQLGLVNTVCEDDALMYTATLAAADLAAQPPAALRLTKSLLKRNQEAISAAMAEEGQLFAERLQSPEAAEAFQAFMERRKPDFSKFS